jgi:hypothetical protein
MILGDAVFSLPQLGRPYVAFPWSAGASLPLVRSVSFGPFQSIPYYWWY